MSAYPPAMLGHSSAFLAKRTAQNPPSEGVLGTPNPEDLARSGENGLAR
jgi:hypothetical protein